MITKLLQFIRDGIFWSIAGIKANQPSRSSFIMMCRGSPPFRCPSSARLVDQEQPRIPCEGRFIYGFTENIGRDLNLCIVAVHLGNYSIDRLLSFLETQSWHEFCEKKFKSQAWFAISLLCLSSSQGLEKSRLCLFEKEKWGDLSMKRLADINFEEVIEYQPWEAGACEREGDGVGVDDVLQIVLHKLRTNLGHVTSTESL